MRKYENKRKYVLITIIVCLLLVCILVLCACNPNTNISYNEDTTSNESNQGRSYNQEEFIISVIAIIVSAISITISIAMSHSTKKDSFVQIYMDFKNNSVYIDINTKLKENTMEKSTIDFTNDELKIVQEFYSYMDVIASEYRRMRLFKIAFKDVIIEIADRSGYFGTLQFYFEEQGRFKYFFKTVKKEWIKKHIIKRGGN